jgi:hypothetical protein
MGLGALHTVSLAEARGELLDGGVQTIHSIIH